MKQIERKNFFNFSKDLVLREAYWLADTWAFHKRRGLFTPFNLISVLILFGFILGFARPVGWAFSVSLAALLIHLHWIALHRAQGFDVKRLAPQHSQEGHAIDITYEIFNGSVEVLPPGFLIDSFSGTRSGILIAIWNEPILPGSTFRTVTKCECNGGMGTFAFGPIETKVHDPLGVFEYQIQEYESSQIQVLPRIERVPGLILPGSPDSLLYGLHNVPERGSSVNFLGLRNYVRGDPLKNIAWRLTAKHGRLLVKEFEKNVNSDVTFLVDLNPQVHAGESHLNTWEVSKDVALALAYQEGLNGSRFQLISQNVLVEFGVGVSHAHEIALRLMDSEPDGVQGVRTEPTIQRENLHTLVRFSRGLIPLNTCIVYIAPLFADALAHQMDDLLYYKIQGHHVVCIFINPEQYLLRQFRGIPALAHVHVQQSNTFSVENLLNELTSHEVEVIAIELGDELSQQFLEYQMMREGALHAT